MENCTVRKYKSGVSADLVKYGELRLDVYSGSGIVLTTNGEIIKGIDVTINGNEEYTAPSGGWNSMTLLGEGQLNFTNKYRGTFENPTFGVNLPMDYTCIEQLKYVNVRSFCMIGYSNAQDRDNIGDGVTLKYIAENLPSCIKQLSLCGKYISGDISDLFVYKNNLVAFGYGYAYNQAANTRITGDFDDLGHFYNVSNFYKTLEYFTNLSGTVEGFVSNRLSEAPATAGTVTFNNLGLGNRITYNGNAVPSGTTTISWDSQGNITLT